MKKFYLYKIVNSVNDKVYIGITTRLKARFREHLGVRSKCTKLARAMDKHGRDNFSMQVLCCGLEDYIVDLEFKAIAAYDSVDNGYNILNGHPNLIGATMPTGSKEKISKSLKKFYAENPGHLDNRKVVKPVADTPHFISGFWFTSLDLALATLRMNEKSFYKWRKEGTLGEVCHPMITSVSHTPVYLLGFWFPDIFHASSSLNEDQEFLKHLMRISDVEECLKVARTKIRTKSPDSPIGVSLRESGNFRAAMFYKNKKVLCKTFKTELEAATAYDDCFEEIHGKRPNNTSRRRTT